MNVCVCACVCVTFAVNVFDKQFYFIFYLFVLLLCFFLPALCMFLTV